MRSIIISITVGLFTITQIVAQNVDVTFRVDLSAETISGDGVHIAGSFQSEAGLGADWTPGSTLMSDANGDNVYEITVSLPPGTYEYKFINGNAWGMDENPPADCSVGANNNREVTVGSTDLVLPILPFNGCIVSLHLSVNMTGQVVSPEGVHVMGDFQVAAGYVQNWDPTSVKMEDQNGDGTYDIQLTLPFGTYQFKFVNGNTLQAGENNLPDECTLSDMNGGRVRNILFTADNSNNEVYCFNSCDLCHPASVFTFDTHWWNDAVFYEIFVRSFKDSNGNGIGDFNGMIEKLDYLNDGDSTTSHDLGITGIWLMPMMKSPSYHGYDVTDYYAVEPDYGTMEDFDNFLDAAHERGIKVIIDLVLNHASSQHTWFSQSANNAGGYREWFRWSPSNPGTIGPWGQTVWHPAAGNFFYGLFWNGMPDLNYRHGPVKDEMFKVVDFWLDRNVDGYRLDAIKYLVEDGNVLENIPETFDLIEEYHDVTKANDPEAFSIGEVWSSTESIIPYVLNDRLDACFEFGLAGAIIDAVNTGNPLNLEQQLEKVLGAYPQLQYGTFLTNHDINRVFNTFGSNIEKMKLAASIYLTLPGIPFIYYGEEIGLMGTGEDVNKRKPMQWTDQSFGGFSSVNPWTGLGSNWQTNNVQEMSADPNSLLSHYRYLIHMRNKYESLRRGQTVEVTNNSDPVFSFARVLEEEAILLVANTGTQPSDPLLSMERSSLPPGEYFVTELLSFQSVGKIIVNEDGGFSGWHSEIKSIAGRASWVLLLSNVDPVTAVPEPEEYAGMQVMPNPAHDSFQISCKEIPPSGLKVQIISATGVLVFQKKITEDRVTVVTTGWAPGIYIVQITNHQGVEIESMKVVIEK